MSRRHRSLGAPLFDAGDQVVEDIDPLSNMTNLVDAMLVFACGLMLALVTFWEIDIPDIREVTQEKEMKEVNDVQVSEDLLVADGMSYQERGVVYEDPNTGQLYLLEETDENEEIAE